MTNTLIVWEEIPEKTTFYLVPNSVLDERRLKLLNLAAGTFVNTECESAATIWLMEAVSDKREYCENVPEEDKCVFAQYKVSSDEPLVADVTRVILSGFML